MKFKLVSSFKPTGDQPEAIEKLVSGLNHNLKNQVLLGVTGSGKTYTMAQVINKIQKPTLIISHNKTLAAQLYQEFRDFFPENCVSYFVSYYDYYQPEAYLPQTDTYLEKETQINDLLDKLRLQATTNLLTRKDTIIVASVSCIYNLGSPKEYQNYVLELRLKQKIQQKEILGKLAFLQYERSDYDFTQGTYRVRGDRLDIFPAYEDFAYRITLEENKVKNIVMIDPLTGDSLCHSERSEESPANAGIHLGQAERSLARRISGARDDSLKQIVIYPAKHYLTDPSKHQDAIKQIREDLSLQVASFKKQNKLVEAQRINQRVNYDLEMIKEVGYVNGIENYSRYFDNRKIGDPPYSLLEYFREPYKNNGWLCFVDESHMTVPQLNGMYRGDRSRKQTLIDFGFRLPAALDNRPLKFEELLRRLPQTIYVSATPSTWEMSRSDQVVQQLVRPTGLIDPEIIIKKTKGQIEDLILEIKKRVAKKERVLVTTLTKKMAEDLAEYLGEPKDIKVAYLHSDVQTLDRQDILEDLRKGNYDVLVGINLLREGLDLPEVSLVAILDADKEGFLRSETSLIQTMGRASRHVHGQVIMYADKITGSMKRAIDEVNRRRLVQLKYNKKHKITPKSIKKPIREKLIERTELLKGSTLYKVEPWTIKIDELTPEDKKKLEKNLRSQMNQAARDLDFELAAKLRDKIKSII